MNIALLGYGNLAKGIHRAALAAPDMSLIGAFTRRAPHTVHPVAPLAVYAANRVEEFLPDTDVLLLCGGSKEDLPVQTPAFAARCNVVDSFDTHEAACAHFAAVDRAARKSAHLALVCAGWDPGLFSVARLIGAAVLPAGGNTTFWGPGVSQGHSDALRRVPGVIDAREYTVPCEEALAAARRGEVLSARQCKAGMLHRRVCYVVAAPDADRECIAASIRAMPYYFAGYETEIHFISKEQMHAQHTALPHAGTVICTGKSASDSCCSHTMEFSVRLSSNPDFTGSVLLAFARAVFHLYKEGKRGCITPLDVPPALLLPLPARQIRQKYL